MLHKQTRPPVTRWTECCAQKQALGAQGSPAPGCSSQRASRSLPPGRTELVLQRGLVLGSGAGIQQDPQRHSVGKGTSLQRGHAQRAHSALQTCPLRPQIFLQTRGSCGAFQRSRVSDLWLETPRAASGEWLSGGRTICKRRGDSGWRAQDRACQAPCRCTQVSVPQWQLLPALPSPEGWAARAAVHL